MSEYYADIEMPLYEDCNFDSKITKYIPAKTLLESDEDIGGVWYKVYDDQYNEGWMYAYDSDGNFLFEDGYKLGVDYFTIGEQILIPSDKSFVSDMYNNTLVVKDSDDNPLFFTIKDIAIEPERVRIFEKGTSYWFKTEDVAHANQLNSGPMLLSNNIMLADIPSDVTDSSIPDVTSTTSKSDNIVNGNQNSSTNSSVTSANPYEGATGKQIKEYLEGFELYNKFFKTDENGKNTTISTIDNVLRTDDISTIFGAPYQFLPHADLRIYDDPENSDSGGNVTHLEHPGAKYAEKILARMPLLVMVPGTPIFLEDYSKDQQDILFKATIDGSANKASEDFKDIMSKSGKYYDFANAWDTYFTYVNPLCNIAAVLLGLGDKELAYPNGGSALLSEYRWQDATNKVLATSLNYNHGVCFYLNSETNVTEMFSNDTSQPAIANTINQMSDKMRELLFMISSDTLGNPNTDTMLNKIGNSVSTKDRSGLKMTILSGLSSIMRGGKMLFPDIWSDSQFSRSYSINIRLVSPDSDQLSLYLNIIVPILHLICLASPRSLATNTYTAPFLVRAYYKGFMNVNMGIITSMNITKGNTGSWTYEGIPTEVEISLDIKDLWSNMLMMSSEYGDKDSNGVVRKVAANIGLDILANTTLMDYIANLCGVNINEPSMARSVELYRAILSKNLNAINHLNAIGDTLNRWVYDKLNRISQNMAGTRIGQ